MPSFKPQKWRQLRRTLGKLVVKKIFASDDKTKSVLGVLKKFIISGCGLDEKANVPIDQAVKVCCCGCQTLPYPEAVADLTEAHSRWAGHCRGVEAARARRQLPCNLSEQPAGGPEPPSVATRVHTSTALYNTHTHSNTHSNTHTQTHTHTHTHVAQCVHSPNNHVIGYPTRCMHALVAI